MRILAIMVPYVALHLSDVMFISSEQIVLIHSVYNEPSDIFKLIV